MVNLLADDGPENVGDLFILELFDGRFVILRPLLQNVLLDKVDGCKSGIIALALAL